MAYSIIKLFQGDVGELFEISEFLTKEMLKRNDVLNTYTKYFPTQRELLSSIKLKEVNNKISSFN